LHTCYTENFFTGSELHFSFCGNLLLRESPFNIANCLKPFDFNLFFVYTLRLYIKTYDLLQSLLLVALEWFFSFLTKYCKNKTETLKGWPHGISVKGGGRRPPHSPTPISILGFTQGLWEGVREVHCTRARKVKGPERMKVRALRLSVIKPKIMVALSICSAGSFNHFTL